MGFILVVVGLKFEQGTASSFEAPGFRDGQRVSDLEAVQLFDPYNGGEIMYPVEDLLERFDHWFSVPLARDVVRDAAALVF